MEVDRYSSSNGAESSPRFGMTLQSPKLSPRDAGIIRPIALNGPDISSVCRPNIPGHAKNNLETASLTKLPMETSRMSMFTRMDINEDSLDSEEEEEEEVAGSAPASVGSGSPARLTSDRKMAAASDMENDVDDNDDDQRSMDESASKAESNTNSSLFGDQLSEKEEEEAIECGECDTEFSTLSLYMEHNCAKRDSKRETTSGIHMNHVNGSMESDLSDVESFEGRIVYNPDGSAYIIEGDDSELSESESLIDIKEGSIVDKRGSHEPPNVPYPQIANAFFVPKNPTSFFNSFYMVPSAEQSLPEAPIMHSYKVYDVRKGNKKSKHMANEDNNNKETNKSAQDSSDDQSRSSTSPVDATTVPTKPILMCFICKLSFGFAKSFISHAVSEHTMTLNDKEKGLMSRKNASAIIQGVGKDKEPLMSFLEPNPPVRPFSVSSSARGIADTSFMRSSAHSPVIAKDTTNVSYVYTKPNVSDCISRISTSSSSHFDLPFCGRNNDKVLPKPKPELSPPKTNGPEHRHKNRDKAAEGALSISPKSPHKLSSSLHNAMSRAEDLLQEGIKKVSPASPEDSLIRKQHSCSTGSIFTSQNGIAASDYNSNIPTSLDECILSSQNQLIGGFLGACDEHPQGRAHGVECPKCDMVLSSSRSLGGHMTMMHSRNSCKTLKCPKCNWHYKYQETLEIHMKEKHPDSDTQCVYCITGQPHPRLARGETYTCGYKPYRCDVCNYSTTTKGNLSIHMQSDKHLNNMQELANGGELNKITQSQPFNDNNMQKKQQQKPKPTWRCDVCNYETNVARNLRIHMTSEKHTHNMMVLQQNMKHMQRDMHLQMGPLGLFGQQEHPLIGFPQLAPAGFPYEQFDQPMFLAAMPGNMNFPMNLTSKEQEGIVPSETNGGGHIGDPAELFQCCVCNIYSVDSVEALHQHMQMDRTKQREHENITMAGGTYLCNLCTYKTNLKANFQLHCKTDKHLQRLQLVNHIREGGPSNEWRLKYLNVSNPVQVHCNACDYYTNSIHKLQIHTTNHQHEGNAQIFLHLQISETRVNADNKYYHCALCAFSTKTKLGLIQHVRSMKHLRSESLHQLQLKQQGTGDTFDPSKFFLVKEYKDGDDISFDEADGERDEEGSTQDGDISDVKNTMPSLLHGVPDLPTQPDSAQTLANSAISTSAASLSSETAAATPRSWETGTPQTGSSPSSTGSAHRDSNGNLPSSSSGAISMVINEPRTEANGSNNNNNSIPGACEADQEPIHVCPYCNFSSVNEMRLQAHVLTQHGQVPREILCPLCQDDFKEKAKLEKHLVQVHNVTAEGLQRLMVMVDHTDWTSPSKSSSQQFASMSQFPLTETDEINIEAIEEAAKLAAEDAIDTAAVQDKTDDDHQYRCQTCAKTFCNIDALYAHQNELGHLELKQTPRGPGYLCWKKGCNQYFKTAQSLQVHFREIHAKRQQLTTAEQTVYTYRCNQCSLAFKSADKQQIHSQYHLIQAVTQCKLCNRSFRSIASLRKHIETSHVDMNDNEKDQIHGTLAANALALLNAAGMEIFKKSQTFVSATEEDKENPGSAQKGESHAELMDTYEESSSRVKLEPVPSPDDDKGRSSESSELNDYKEHQFMEDYINSQSIAEGSYDDPSRKYKCHRCKVAFTKQSYLTGHNKTLQHRKGDKLSYPMEKYLDPNRPYKCDVCKESFTQKNILLVHYNSVSHLHKLKQAAQQGTLPVVTAPSPSPTPAPALIITSQNNNQQPPPQPIISDNGDKKPYRCNVCKVAYSQGSTLDIHMRSVLHQTRASKLPELVMAGQIDPSLPLIEQPETTKSQQQQQQQQKKILSEMLQPKQMAEIMGTNPLAHGQPHLLFHGFPGGFPNIPGLSSMSLAAASQAMHAQLSSAVMSQVSHMTVPSPQHAGMQNGKSETQSVTALTKSMKSLITAHSDGSSKPQDLQLKPKTSEESESFPHFKPDPDRTSSPKIQTKLQNPFALESFAPNSLAAAIHDAVAKQHQQQQLQQQLESAGQLTPTALTSAAQIQSALRSRNFPRFKAQVHKNLLENIGFECVMQFNEFNQISRSKRDRDGETEEEDEGQENEVDNQKESEVKSEETAAVVHDDHPEINRSVCATCSKEFSSIWVLKSHEEEFHGVLVPIQAVEDFGEKFKTDYEKKQPKEPEQQQPLTPAPQNAVATPAPSVNSPMSMESLFTSEMTQNPLDMAQLSMPMFNMMPMPMALNMPMGMNMHPPLIPMMMPHNLEGPSFTPPMSMVDSSLLAQKQIQIQQQQQQQQQQNQNSKRARTRISDEQLKILRAHFDINNSPSEEQIITMSEQSGLPQKVIKHWFRNTLFKERQRNKDSPYNFNNPPSTQLNLEEYEKTGKVNNLDLKEEVEEDQLSVPTTPVPPELKEPKEILPVNLGLVKMERPEMNLLMPPVTSSPPTLSLPMTSMASPTSSDTLEFYDLKMSPNAACKRAIRTRFTDYQIKLLQEYFEQNAYPKDDDLDHLSKMLNLSPRVIVVWFQNARQKARKSYENQPVLDLSAEETPHKRTKIEPGPASSYQCKKCSAVFHRHYELIRHQKNKCLPEEDGGTSILSTSFSGDEDDNSSISPDDLSQNASSEGTSRTLDDKGEPSDGLSLGNFKCEKCKLTFKRFEQWNEHQNVHMMNPTLFPPFPPGESAFAMLQSVAQQHENKSPLKRKMEEHIVDDYGDQPRDKRLRTTILPEQLDYLYQKYQLDCSPSRKQLENISQDVGLKKRVVQVWFQNTRARERKGQYRAHQQLIHKRCPFCRALFRAKSALESHLATKHPEEMAKGELNVDNIPDASMDSMPSTPQPPATPTSSGAASAQNFDFTKLMGSPLGLQSYLPFMPPGGMPLGFPPSNDSLQMSMKKMYEDSLKKYIDELSAASHIQQPSLIAAEVPSKHLPAAESHSHDTKRKAMTADDDDDDVPLDLSKPIKVNTDTEKISEGPSTDVSERSFEEYFHRRRTSLDDSYSETLSETEIEMHSQASSNPTSPNSLHGRPHSGAGKRYRTQMTNLQVRIMKMLFTDYKTPTMAECEMLGREIGLPKRVVQVWFQNARAKEKKSKLQYQKTFGTDVDFNRPPEDCNLCNFKYSHKYTVQDHIFTKKHIENAKKFLQNQAEAERELTDPRSMSQLFQEHQSRGDRERVGRKLWEESGPSSTSSQIAQLQAMGLNSLPSSVTGSGNAEIKKTAVKKENHGSNSRKDDSGKRKSSSLSSASATAAYAAAADAEGTIPIQMMSPFANFLPGVDPSLLSYMYPGMPSFYPGLGMPMMPPGFFPGAEHLFAAYDPTTYGTPLPLLQIPQATIKSVSSKLADPSSSLTQYTQDCKSFADLKTAVTSADYRLATEATVDVGYICKKCQMVYPGKEACVNHQRTLCFLGKLPENMKTILKLEQIQYECKACNEKTSTIHEFKVHCQLEAHKTKASRYKQQHHHSSTSSGSSHHHHQQQHHRNKTPSVSAPSPSSAHVSPKSHSFTSSSQHMTSPMTGAEKRKADLQARLLANLNAEALLHSKVIDPKKGTSLLNTSKKEVVESQSHHKEDTLVTSTLERPSVSVPSGGTSEPSKHADSDTGDQKSK